MRFITTVLLLLWVNYISSQNKDVYLRDFFSSVVHIADSIPATKTIKNKVYEIVLKDPKNGKLKNLNRFKLGTGFFIKKDLDVYLVTAAHVAKNLSINTKLTYQSRDGEKKQIIISELLRENTRSISWIIHPKADVAVLHIPLDIIETDFFKSLHY